MLPDLLTPIDISLDDVLLDPNNPRFAELGEEIDVVPENRFAEEKVQKNAFDRMKKPQFDVNELRDTIKTLGFLPMDRIVVRKLNILEKDKYVVVEGNRRIAALKWLIELHEAGKETFSDDELKNFKELEVLELDTEKAPDSAKWILPGLRHVSGIKQWGPYQRASAVYILRESGETSQETAQSLGLSTRAANQLWRCYLALEQMKKDEEYGEHAEPKYFSYFEESIKSPKLRGWLKWSDDAREFTNAERLREFYSWIIGEIDDEGNLKDPKLSDAKDLRDVAKLIDDEKAFNAFRAPNGTLVHALSKYEAAHPEDWRPALEEAKSVLKSLPADVIRELTPQDIEDLKALGDRINKVLEYRDKLLS